MKKSADIIAAHMLLSEHVPEAVIELYSHEIDLDKVSNRYAEIFKEHFRDSSIDESLLIVAMLLKEIYSQIGKESNNALMEVGLQQVKPDKVINKKLKEFLVSYN